MLSLEFRASLYALLSGFLYGFIGFFGLSVLHANVSVPAMLFWRFFIAAIATFIIILPTLKNNQDRWQDLLWAFTGGAAFYSLSTMCYFSASLYIGSGIAMVVFFTYPVMVMFINAFFLKQKIQPFYYVAMLIIFLGMLFLIDMHEFAMDLKGILFSTLSSALYAGYIIFSKKCRISANMSTLMISSGCALTCFLFTLMNHSFVIPTTFTVWANLLGIGIISTVAPIFLLLHSLKHINSERASILSVSEPIAVVILGVLLLGENITPKNAVGVVIVLVGAMLTLFSYKFSKSQAKQ